MAATGELVTGKRETDEPPQLEATKEELQRRMEEARESISQTVGDIRDTVEDQYASVKATVTGVLDWREGFQRDPIVWSVGALAAGFAFGYTFGVAEKGRTRPGNKASALSMFAENLIGELGKAGSQLPLLSLAPQVKALFGVDLPHLLAEIGGTSKRPRRTAPAKKKHLARRRVGRKRR